MAVQTTATTEVTGREQERKPYVSMTGAGETSVDCDPCEFDPDHGMETCGDQDAAGKKEQKNTRSNVQ